MPLWKGLVADKTQRFEHKTITLLGSFTCTDLWHYQKDNTFIILKKQIDIANSMLVRIILSDRRITPVI